MFWCSSLVLFVLSFAAPLLPVSGNTGKLNQYVETMRAFNKFQFSLVSQACVTVFFKLFSQIFRVISKSNGVRELMFWLPVVFSLDWEVAESHCFRNIQVS